ncbi:hypothetical protein IID21_01635 [Patescibacteria group bacterium]|nr:hypothetical protein [Patescibacteria group bacterium]
MSKKQSKKFIKSLPLDNYERELDNFLNKGEFRRVGNFQETKKMFQEAAKRHKELLKTKRITIRVNQEDLLKVKAKAKRVRIPYQRLLNALIHQFAEGKREIKIK